MFKKNNKYINGKNWANPVLAGIVLLLISFTMVILEDNESAAGSSEKPDCPGKTASSPTVGGWDGVVEVSAYNAMESQTDSTPTITANGDIVYEGGIASNCYPFGTKIELQGLGVFIVNDRMASRYSCNNADIFLWNYFEAIQFGRQKVKIRVVYQVTANS